MIDFIQKRIEKLYGELSQYEQLRVNAENEYQAMSCGAFNPRFLAMIKEVKSITTNRKRGHTPFIDWANGFAW